MFKLESSVLSESVELSQEVLSLSVDSLTRVLREKIGCMSAGGLIGDNGCPPTMLLPSIGEVLGGSYCPIKVQSIRGAEIGICKPLLQKR